MKYRNAPVAMLALLTMLGLLACGTAAPSPEDGSASTQSPPAALREVPTPTGVPMPQQEDSGPESSPQYTPAPEPAPTVCVRIDEQDKTDLDEGDVKKDGVIFFCHEWPEPTPKYELLGYYSQFAQEAEEAAAAEASDNSADVELSKDSVFIRGYFESPESTEAAADWVYQQKENGKVHWMNHSDKYGWVDADIDVELLLSFSALEGLESVDDAHKQYNNDQWNEPEVKPDADGNPIPPKDIHVASRENANHGDFCYPTGGNLYTGNEEYTGPEDIDQFMFCYEEMLQDRFEWPYGDILPPIWKAWPTLRQATDDDPVVASAHRRVVSCLAEKGHTNVPEKLLFYWQYFAKPETLRMRLADLTAEEHRQMRLVARPTDDCALDHGYYLAQSDAWRQLVNPIVAADTEHELVDALVISHIHFLLWLPGTVHMLTLDGALPLVQVAEIVDPPNVGEVDDIRSLDPSEFYTDPSHPKGIAGCKKSGYFMADMDYTLWCEREAEIAIYTLCESKEDKAACARDYFSDWIAPEYYRSAECVIHPSSNQPLLGECLDDEVKAAFIALDGHGKEWAAVLATVNTDTNVAGALQRVKQFLSTKGTTSAPDKLLYYRQDYVGRPDLYETFIENLSTSEAAQMESLREPSQQRGDQESFFAAQETAMITELERLQTADPTKIAGLEFYGLLAALKEPGILPALYGVDYCPWPIPNCLLGRSSRDSQRGNNDAIL